MRGCSIRTAARSYTSASNFSRACLIFAAYSSSSLLQFFRGLLSPRGRLRGLRSLLCAVRLLGGREGSHCCKKASGCSRLRAPPDAVANPGGRELKTRLEHAARREAMLAWRKGH